MRLKKKKLRIRDARPGDRDSIREVTLSAFQEYAAIMPSRWEGYRQNILTTLADVKPAEQIVAEKNGTIVGAVLLYPAGTMFPSRDAPLAWPEARLLAVAPAERGQGVGRALMQACIERARRSGAGALSLHTTDMMRVAMGMYERMGFGRAPELDFQVDEDLTVKGYRFNLDDPVPKEARRGGRGS